MGRLCWGSRILSHPPFRLPHPPFQPSPTLISSSPPRPFPDPFPLVPSQGLVLTSKERIGRGVVTKALATFVDAHSAAACMKLLG
jgi:hypothetical protein